MSASIAATSSRDSGCVMSMPDTSPANTGVIWRIVMVTVGSSVMSFGGEGFLRHRHFCPTDGGAAHVAHLGVIEPTHAVHDLAVVPHHQIPLPPLVRIDELRLRCMFHQVADESARLRHWPTDDGADMRRQKQRFPPRDRMRAHQALAHWSHRLAFFGSEFREAQLLTRIHQRMLADQIFNL